MLDNLTHAVQCRRTTGTCGLGWETIAAFDNRVIAQMYVHRCAENAYLHGSELEYRMREIER